jgi:hypothetical protein
MAKQFFYFSDSFKAIFAALKFAIIIIVKFLIILFRSRKGIKLLELDYSKKYLFDKSYLIVSYKFKNALWYDFKNLKQTTNSQKVIFNLQNLKSNKITLIVHGFFQKKFYYINIEPEKILETKSFRTKIFVFDEKISFTPEINFSIKEPLITLTRITIPKKKLKIFNKEIKINHSFYTQTDFL